MSRTTARAVPKKKSERTREQVLDIALKLFTKQGFEATTMRQVAEATGLSLGAAYYYFDSKDAILFAYYARNREEHATRAAERLADARDLRGRIGAILHTGLDVIARERKVLGALIGRLADPHDPISAFSKDQSAVRDRSIAMFASAFDGEPVPEALRSVAAPALWMMYMGLLLYFVRDDSPKQAKTRRLVDDTLDLVAPLLQLAGSPLSAPLISQLSVTLARADLLPRR